MRYKYSKRKTKYAVKLGQGDAVTAHGGQLLVDAMARRLGLWEAIAQSGALDVRKKKGQGYEPETMAAQIIFNLTSGGQSLSDCERLGKDKVLMEALGMPSKVADQSTVGEWLRGIGEKGAQRLWEINAKLVKEVLKAAKPNRVKVGGELEVFFDDTEIEVYGKKFEGAKKNYNGDMALSFQALWVSDFLMDGDLGSPRDVASMQGPLLECHAGTWAGGKAHFFADSASSPAKYLEQVEVAGFSSWGVSYNKWTEVLDRLAGELPEFAWAEQEECNDGDKVSYAWIMHTPGEKKEAQTFAARRTMPKGEMFYRYSFVACEKEGTRSPLQVMERHRTKGEREQLFSEILTGLDLHHPPCLSLGANEAFYALGAMAYNLLKALQVLELDDDCQNMKIQSLIRYILTIPAKQIAHANRKTLHICVPAGWLRWWRTFLYKFFPKRKRGETIDEAYHINEASE